MGQHHEPENPTSGKTSVEPLTPIYNPSQAARGTAVRRDFRIGMGLALVLCIVFVAFPTGWTLFMLRKESSNRQPAKIAADLVSRFGSTRKVAGDRYSDVMQRDVAEQIYQRLIEMTRRADELSDPERAVLTNALARTPSHYKFVDAKVQARLLGAELNAVLNATQADMLLNVLTSDDMISDTATIEVISEFIRNPAPQAFSYYGKSRLVWSLLAKLGFLTKSFDISKRDKFRQLNREQATLLSAALKEYVENTQVSDIEGKIIHRDSTNRLGDEAAEGSAGEVSTDEVTQLIHKAIDALSNPLSMGPVYDFNLDVPDDALQGEAGAEDSGPAKNEP